MSDVIIQQVRLDPDGRLRVRPATSANYQYVYRDASSVRWDDRNGELYVLQEAGLDALAEFQQIISAVRREYSDRLLVSSSTKCVDVPGDLVTAIAKYAR